MAQKIVYDSDAVSDIVQDVYLYLLTKMNENHKIESYKSWLCRATINKCLDYQKTRNKISDIDCFNDYCENLSNIEQEETKVVLKKALSNLKEEERMLAVLYSEGLSYKEMAEILEIKMTSIGKMLSRTLKKLEKELKKMRYEVS